MPLLIYTGPRLSTGEPERNLNYDGIPEGDLDSDALTPEQLEIVKRSGLYGALPESGAPARPRRKQKRSTRQSPAAIETTEPASPSEPDEAGAEE